MEWCDELDGEASQRFANKLDNFLLNGQNAKNFSWLDIKNYVLYYMFIYPDYRLLDMKLYKNSKGR